MYKKKLMTIGMLLVFCSALFLLFKKNNPSFKPTETTTELAPEPTRDPNDVYHQSKGEKLTIEKVSVTIPKDWWYYKGVETFQIHPEYVDIEQEILPAFLLSLIREISVGDVQTNLVDNLKMTDVATSSATVAGKPAVLIKGKVADIEGYSYKGPMLLALIADGSDVYIFHDMAQLENHEQYYQQMLDSLSFAK